MKELVSKVYLIKTIIQAVKEAKANGVTHAEKLVVKAIRAKRNWNIFKELKTMK